MTSRRRRLPARPGLAIALLATGALALTACSSGINLSDPTSGGTTVAALPSTWSDVVAQAEKEGQVALYSPLADSTLTRLEAGFEKAYPQIKLVSNRGTSSTSLETQVDQERQSGAAGADVLIATDTPWFDSHTANLIKPAGPAAAGWPAAYLNDEGKVPVGSLEPFGIAYNTAKVHTPITGYADLKAPDLKGHIATSSLTAPPIIAWYDWLDQTQGAGFVETLQQTQQLRQYTGSAPLAQSVASGEEWVSLFAIQANIDPLIASGGSVKFVQPKPSLGTAYLAGALGWAKHPAAAAVLLDYLMSADGQKAWHSDGATASPLPDIPGSLPISSVTAWPAAKYDTATVTARKTYWTGVLGG